MGERIVFPMAKKMLFPLERSIAFEHTHGARQEPLAFDAAFLHALIIVTRAHKEILFGRRTPGTGTLAIIHFADGSNFAGQVLTCWRAVEGFRCYDRSNSGLVQLFSNGR